MNSKLINPGPIEFEAEILTENGPIDSAWISFPYDLKETYGKGNLVPVKALLDDKIEYHGSLAKMGLAHPCLILRKDVRERLGKQPGDKVKVRIELDENRKLEIPSDIKQILVDELHEYFKSLSYTHQKEYVQWIEDAKKPETRQNRLQKMKQMLQDEVKTPR